MTESVLRVGRDKLTCAVMLASPTHLSYDLTINAVAGYPLQVKHSGVVPRQPSWRKLLRKMALQSHSLAISHTSRSGTLCLIGISLSLRARRFRERPVKRAHVDPGFHLAPG